MARHEALDEDDLPPPPPRGLTREKLKSFLERRYSTRLHMTLILLASGFASMVSSWTMLHAGVHSMLVRYPVSLTLSYATFLFGVWVWLRLTGLAPRERPARAGRNLKDGGFDLPLGSNGGSIGSSGGSGGGSVLRGGGGTFDGGGASASFAETRIPMAVAVPDSNVSSASSSKSGTSSGFDLGLDGDGLALIIVAILLVVAIFACSGYLIWMAPDVLAEAAFGAALTGTLARPTAAQAATGWIAGVVRKTWWPFAVVFVLALGFAAWAASHYPHAATFKQALVAAMNPQQEERKP